VKLKRFVVDVFPSISAPQAQRKLVDWVSSNRSNQKRSTDRKEKAVKTNTKRKEKMKDKDL